MKVKGSLRRWLERGLKMRATTYLLFIVSVLQLSVVCLYKGCSNLPYVLISVSPKTEKQKMKNSIVCVLKPGSSINSLYQDEHLLLTDLLS